MRRTCLAAMSAVALVAVTPAQAASTRADYIAQVDPICQSFVEPAGDAKGTFNKNLKRLLRLAKKGTLKAFVKQNNRTARSLERLAELLTSLTDQIAAVPPPPADAGTIGTWLGFRREANEHASSAASSLKKFRARKAFKKLDRAGDAEDAAIGAISGFGFQVCGVSI